jgi:hypothetical protein
MIICSSSLFAQDAKDIFNAEKIVFCGLDFSKTKFEIPDAKPDEIKKTLIPAWNTMVMTDNERFPKESAFQKLNINGDPTVVERRNDAINIKDAMGAGSQLSASAIQDVINDYTDGYKKEGVGVVFIIESFSKKDVKAVAQVVFFDIAKHKVLLAKRLSGTPRGGGLKNFWTGAIQAMFENIVKTEFDLWKKEVLKK